MQKILAPKDCKTPKEKKRITKVAGSILNRMSIFFFGKEQLRQSLKHLKRGVETTWSLVKNKYT